MMKRMTSVFLTAGVLLAACAVACAQARTQQGELPPDVPANIRKHVEGLRSADPARRVSAACALGRMEARATPAIPALVALMSDGTPVSPGGGCGNEPPFEDEEWQPRYEGVLEPSPGEAATHALMAIGGEAIPALVDTLRHGPHWRARKNAAWALAHTGSAVEALTAALKDEAWQVRAEAAYALFQRGGAGAEVVGALVTALGDEAWQVRAQAAFALGHKGDSRVDVIPPLLSALKDADARVRAEAAGGLWHTADKRAFAPLLEALKDEDPRVRAGAARTLGNRVDDDGVELLRAALTDADPRVREGARRALEIVGHRARGRVTNLGKKSRP